MSKSNIDLSMLSSIEDDRYISLKDCLKGIDLDKYEIPICLGRDSDKNIVFRDFVDIKNILMSGMTHSGKSVFINSFINTILLSKTPENVRFIMIDGKMVGLFAYNGISHLLYPVCEDFEKGLQLIEWCIEDIGRRKKESKKKPYIVLVIDEFADLMLGDASTNSKLEKIAKEGSDVGIHMILSSSKPTLTVFTPQLKNAIHSRLVGAMASGSDSKELIGEESGIDLLGNGDMIFKDVKSGEKIRVQAPWISTEEQELVITKVSRVSEYKDIELKERCLELQRMRRLNSL
jgi:DNA segregation ATPase FtsK/SpoIIIE, S-DNA-T family